VTGWAASTPVAGFAGGLMIGLAGAIMLLGLGRIAGISGLAARTAGLAGGAPWPIAVAFIAGLPVGTACVAAFAGGIAVRIPPSLPMVVAGGLLVGFGTRLGRGCTSGHGVCGVSRLSPRSLAATGCFMASGLATVAILRLAGLLP
jgi:uncharacterized protein